MDYWAWGGKYIGFREGDFLYAKSGKPVGFFRNEDIYSFDGRYLGEVRSNNRLIVNSNKKHKLFVSYSKPCNRVGRAKCNYSGSVMIFGYEDFKITE